MGKFGSSIFYLRNGVRSASSSHADHAASRIVKDVMHAFRRFQPSADSCPNVSSKSSLHVLNLSISSSLESFHHLIDSNIVNEVMKYLKNPSLAIPFFEWAQSHPGFSANASVYASVIRICAEAKSLGFRDHSEQAMSYLNQMKQSGITLDSLTYGVLIDLMARQGHTKLVFEIFDGLKKEGMVIRTKTYNSILSVCDKCGLVERAYSIFQEMHKSETKRESKPNWMTYNHLIKLFGKTAGYHQVYEVFRAMVATQTRLLILAQLRTGAYNKVRELLDELNRIDPASLDMYTILLDHYNQLIPTEKVASEKLWRLMQRVDHPIHKLMEMIVEKSHPIHDSSHGFSTDAQPQESIDFPWMFEIRVHGSRTVWNSEWQGKDYCSISEMTLMDCVRAYLDELNSPFLMAEYNIGQHLSYIAEGWRVREWILKRKLSKNFWRICDGRVSGSTHTVSRVGLLPTCELDEKSL